MNWLDGNTAVAPVEKDQARTSDDITVQGSEAWLKWRGKGIGSSDAAVLLGWSPWKTIDQLYEEKLGNWKPTFGSFQMSAMERGKNLEPVIRDWYETKIRDQKFPDHILEGKKHSFMRASFDGYNSKFVNLEDKTIGRIIEIKAPNAKDHELARNGEIPQKYQPQVQWLMLVGEIPWCDYVSYGADKTYCIVAVRADELIQAELVKRSLVFWSCVDGKAPLPEGFFKKWSYPSKPLDLSDIGNPQIEEQEIELLVADAIALQDEIAQRDARLDIVKDKLKKALGDREKLICGEATFGWQTRKGTVKYADIPELKTIDLEKFRGDDVKAFYFKRSTK